MDVNFIASTNLKPTAVDRQGAEPPDNSEIRKIAEDVLGAAQMSFAAVAADPNRAVRASTLEDTFKQAFALMPAEKRTSYIAQSKALIDLPAASRQMMFGRAGERDFDSHLAAGGFDRYDEGIGPLAINKKLLGVSDTVRVPRTLLRPVQDGLLIPGSALPGGLEEFESSFASAQAEAVQSEVIAKDKLEEVWGTAYERDPFAGGVTGASEFEEFAVTDKMGFWITQVKCVDETGRVEFWKKDKMAVAGLSVDETGDTKKIAETLIGGGFDDGDSKSYPNWRYTNFSLREGTRWPKTYLVTLLLAEKDHGGLSDVMNTVWQQVGAKVKVAIEKAIQGVLSEYLGPVIAGAIGKAVAWVIDKLFGWIIKWWKDDIFPPFTAQVTIPSMGARWHFSNGQWGSPRSDIRTAHFYGHHGHYYVQYYWKFYS